MNQHLETQECQVQELEQVTPELEAKFDNDRSLVNTLTESGITIGELERADIVHPTKMDPVVIVDGQVRAVWL